MSFFTSFQNEHPSVFAFLKWSIFIFFGFALFLFVGGKISEQEMPIRDILFVSFSLSPLFSFYIRPFLSWASGLFSPTVSAFKWVGLAILIFIPFGLVTAYVQFLSKLGFGDFFVIGILYFPIVWQIVITVCFTAKFISNMSKK